LLCKVHVDMLEINLSCTYIAHISVAESKILNVAQCLMVSMGCDVCFMGMCLQGLNLYSTITIDTRIHFVRTFVIAKT